MHNKRMLWIALGLLIFAGWLFVLAVSPQDKPPAMPKDTGIALRDAVLLQARMVIQLRNTIDTYNQLQAALPEQKKKIDDLKTAALTEAKLDPKDWDVDMDKFEFVPKGSSGPSSVPAAAAAPPPAEKKP